MFGYIRPYKPELRMCEYEAYKGIYCGLCRELGKTYGPLARMILSYDGTFAALIGVSLSQECATMQRGMCTCNPLKRCNFLCGAAESLSLAAAVTVLLSNEKVLDDIADSSFLQSIPARLLRPFSGAWAKKAARRYPELSEQIHRSVGMQAKVEKDPDSGLDACAEPSALALQAIFSCLSRSEREARVLQQIGYHLGRWIYLMDASDDLEEDLKKKRFNPLIKKFSLNGNASAEEIRAARMEMNQLLNVSAAQVQQAGALMEFRRLESIIDNIFHQGMADAQRRVLSGEKKKHGARL